MTEVVERAYGHLDVVGLLEALYAEQVDRYGYADPVNADPSEYVPPDGLFLVAYLDGTAIACAGYRTFDRAAGTVEIRKMYTLPQHRGGGLGTTIVAHLERHAAEHGARKAILETGVRNLHALALLEHAGYRRTPSYVAGRDPAINRAFAKALPLVTQSSPMS